MDIGNYIKTSYTVSILIFYNIAIESSEISANQGLMQTHYSKQFIVNNQQQFKNITIISAIG